MTTLCVHVTSEDHIQGELSASIELLMQGDYDCQYKIKSYTDFYI